MGAFFTYEASNARRFEIDTTARKITRPNRKIKKVDLLGAVVIIDGVSVIPVSVYEVPEGATRGDLTVVVVTGDTPALTVLSYDMSEDTFTLGSTALTNVLIDGFGKVVQAQNG